MTTWWPYARLAAAALGLAAVIAQLSLTLQLAAVDPTPWGSHLPTVWWNFLSFFTIDSNVIASVTFIIAGVWSIRHRRDREQEPSWLAILLVCASTYMIVTGIVYNTLLRGYELPQGVTVPWSNEVLHVVFPLILLIDVLFAPRRRALPWGTVFITAAFPLAWAVYTMIRANFVIAPATGAEYWYPYPFLNPHFIPGGYLGVAAYIVGIAIAIIGVACFVVWVGRRRAASDPVPV